MSEADDGNSAYADEGAVNMKAKQQTSDEADAAQQEERRAANIKALKENRYVYHMHQRHLNIRSPLTTEYSMTRKYLLVSVAAWLSSGPLCYQRCTTYQTMLYACANLSSRPTLQQAECLRSASLSGNISTALGVDYP